MMANLLDKKIEDHQMHEADLDRPEREKGSASMWYGSHAWCVCSAGGVPLLVALAAVKGLGCVHWLFCYV